MPRAPETLDLRAAPERLRVLAADVVDRLLLLRHGLDILVEGEPALAALHGLEAREWQQLVLLLGVLVEPFLQHRAEVLPERRVLLGCLLGPLGEVGEDPLDQPGANLRQDRVVLQGLAADVEREIGRIHHAPHEAEIGRQQPLALVGDEDPPDIEPDAVPAHRVEQVEGPGVGHEEQGGVLDPPFGVQVDGVPGIARHVGDMVVELAVLVLADLAPRPAPERRALVDHLLLAALVLEPDRQADMVGVGLDDGADAERLQELPRLLAQVELDAGAACGVGLGRDGEGARPVRAPAPALGLVRPAGHDLDALRDHEGGVEAHAELADEPGGQPGRSVLRVLLVRPVAGLRLGHLLDERLGARARDGAEIVDQLVVAHADAVVGDRQHAGLVVGRDRHLERGIVAEQVGLRDRRVAQLVARVGCVGDQLAQEDLLVAVERVGHEAEQLADLGLERVALPVRVRHQPLR